jgi:hypothetical protein
MNALEDARRSLWMTSVGPTNDFCLPPAGQNLLVVELSSTFVFQPVAGQRHDVCLALDSAARMRLTVSVPA